MEIRKEEKISTATCDVEPDFMLYIKKRIDLRQGWYSCDEIKNFALDLFRLGMEFTHKWNNCFINPPQNDTRVVVNLNHAGDSSTGNQYYICDYKDKKFIDVVRHTPIFVRNDSSWFYLNYPSYIK